MQYTKSAMYLLFWASESCWLNLRDPSYFHFMKRKHQQLLVYCTMNHMIKILDKPGVYIVYCDVWCIIYTKHFHFELIKWIASSFRSIDILDYNQEGWYLGKLNIGSDLKSLLVGAVPTSIICTNKYVKRTVQCRFWIQNKLEILLHNL
jgi:hypothetical protein